LSDSAGRGVEGVPEEYIGMAAERGLESGTIERMIELKRR